MEPLTIVIPNYNGEVLLQRNLPSVVAAAERYPGDAHIIVVDDGSADNSVSVLRERFPGIEAVEHIRNRGFADAVHTGVGRARTELLFLLNSDVELNAGCLERLEPYFAQDDVFSVCPLMLREDGTVNQHSWNLREFRRGGLKLVEWDIDQAIASREHNRLPTLYASGGGMMVSKAKFVELGGFHPIFKPYYGEDFDLGMRAWYRGWPSYFEPRATLVHQSRGSIKDNAERSQVKQVRRRNKYLIEWIHIPAPRLLSTLPVYLFQLLYEVLSLDGVNLGGFASAASRLPDAWLARRAAAAGRVLELNTILATMRRSYRQTAARKTAGS